MAKRAEAYVDTSAFIAFMDRSDSYHPLFRRLFSDPPELITTTLVVAEGHGWFLKRYDRMRAAQFLSMIEDMKPLRPIGVGQEEFIGGVQIIRKFSDQNISLTDAVGLHLMKTHKIKSCWSTDFHLGLTGVSLVVGEY